MPDGDIFYKSVPRNWVKASRLAFGAEDDAAAIAECEKKLARDLNERPWNELASAVQDIAVAMIADEDVVNRRRVLQDLEWFQDKWPSDRYEAMRRVANRLLVRGEAGDRPASPMAIRENPDCYVASGILAESIVMGIAPACLAARHELAGKMDSPEFHKRTAEMRMLLRSAPGVQSLADQMMRAPDDVAPRVRAPRSQSLRLSQDELVNLPIG